MANRLVNYHRCRYCYCFRRRSCRRFRQRSWISYRHQYRFCHADAPPAQSHTLMSPVPDTTAATNLAADIIAAKAPADVPDHTAANAAANADAIVTLRSSWSCRSCFRPSSRFCPSSRSCTASCCHHYLFVRLSICPSVWMSVRPHLTDSLSFLQTVSPFFVPSVRQSVSLSVCLSVNYPSFNRPSVNRPSINRRPSVNRFYWEKDYFWLPLATVSTRII